MQHQPISESAAKIQYITACKEVHAKTTQWCTVNESTLEQQYLIELEYPFTAERKEAIYAGSQTKTLLCTVFSKSCNMQFLNTFLGSIRTNKQMAGFQEDCYYLVVFWVPHYFKNDVF